MEKTRRDIPELPAPSQRAIDEPWWPVLVALFVLCAFLMGTAAAYLPFGAEHGWRDAAVWLFIIPIATCVTTWFLRSLPNRFVRRTLQVSIVLCLLFHLVMLVISLESRVFHPFWEKNARNQPRRPQRALRIVHDYQSHQLDQRQRPQQDFMQPVETAVADSVQPWISRQEPQQEPPVAESQPMPAPRTPRDLPRQAIERPTAAATKPRQSDQSSKLSRQVARSSAPAPNTPARAALPQNASGTEPPAPALAARQPSLPRQSGPVSATAANSGEPASTLPTVTPQSVAKASDRTTALPETSSRSAGSATNPLARATRRSAVATATTSANLPRAVTIDESANRTAELNATSRSSLSRQDPNATPSDASTARGSSDMDLGPNRVADARAVERAPSGGQPDLKLAQNSPNLSRTRSGGSSPLALSTTRVEPINSVPGGAKSASGEAGPLQAAVAMTSRRSETSLDSLPRFGPREEAAPSGTGVSAGTAARSTLDGDTPAIGPVHSAAVPLSRSGGTPFKTATAIAAGTGSTNGTESNSPGVPELNETTPRPTTKNARPPSPAVRSIEVAAVEALGGLGDRVTPEVGVSSRFSSPESVELQSTPSRFIRKEVGGAPELSSSAVFAADAFRRRAPNRGDASRPSATGSAGPQTEEAIELGLTFLARRQHSDGSWTLRSTTEPVELASDTAATGLCLLAFQGAGYNHREYQYAARLAAGVGYLVKNQKPSGDLFVPVDDVSNRTVWLYSHGIAAIALCEAYGMTHDQALREPAQRALDFIVATQDPKRGGWRYQPGIESDTSVTGWMMMALKSGQLAGLQVPRRTYDQLGRWLDNAQGSASQRHLYRYNPQAPDTPAQRHGRTPSTTMTAVGLLMRLYGGWRRDHPTMIAGAEQLRQNPPSIGSSREPLRDTYYWYYGTQVMYHMGGSFWEEWNGQLHPLLIESQIKQGELAGSWSPRSPVPDRWAPQAGRLYVTTMNLLSLEVAYRHLPLYIDTAK